MGTNRIGVVPTATAAVCMNPRTAVDEVASTALVSCTVVLLRMRSIFVSAGIPGPVTSMPLASGSVDGRPVICRLPAVVRPGKSIVSLKVQLVFALVAPCSTNTIVPRGSSLAASAPLQRCRLAPVNT